MNCGFDRELVSMYADGELGRDRILYVESHLAACGDCSTILQEMRKFGSAIRSTPLYRAPNGLVERIVQNVGPADQRSAWQSLGWTSAAIFKVAMHGFTIDDELEELLRKESPPWVARWVLFV